MKVLNRFIFWNAILLITVLTFGTVSVWNVSAQWRVAKAAQAEYDAMDRSDATVIQVGWLRDVLRGSDWRTYRDVKYFTPIQTQMVQIVRELQMASRIDDGDGAAELKLGNAAVTHLDTALQHSTGPGAAPAATAAANELDLMRQALIDIAKSVPGSVRHQITGAAERLQYRLTWTCFWLFIVLVVSAMVHLMQYRVLVRPLLWLRDDMKRSIATNYLEVVRATGDHEFREVAAFFNGLAGELAKLYRGMEEKIIVRSRELVRSERLASVGFLAAGVAHEINNPLSVISGFAELAAKDLRRVLTSDQVGPEDNVAAEAEAEALTGALEAAEIIRDEAFRCKEITSRLLSLARGGDGGRETLCMDELAKQVATLTRGLKNYRDRKVIVEFDHENLEVVANPTEMKQVLLNLTVNALEAVPAGRGEVRIGGYRENGWVEIFVADNGKGMSRETLEQVFEPFFTAKRGQGEPGTGLGLSITHAIIENHGGRISAQSDGPGKGSRFVVRLPARKAAPAIAGASLNSGASLDNGA
jgi:two-component system, NtrC family, sensor kinase